MQKRLFLGLLVGIATTLTASGAHAAETLQTFLLTGNGYGFQTYDNQKVDGVYRTKIDAFYESPYRYPTWGGSLTSDGVRRRNLSWDFFFGVGSSWLSAQANPATLSYVDDTNIILAQQTVGGTAVETYYWSPFGFDGNAMIALLKVPNNFTQSSYALFNFHMGANAGNDGGRTPPDVKSAENEVMSILTTQDAVVETGPGGGAIIYLPLSAITAKSCSNVWGSIGGTLPGMSGSGCNGNDLVAGFQATPSASGYWMGVAILFSPNAADASTLATAFRSWQNSRGPEQLLTDARAEWAAWRKPIPTGVTLSTAEQHLWRQSEAVLRMAQVRVPDASGRVSYGQVLASLPNLTSWKNGPEDWMDWSTAWVRDGCYGIVGLARSGHTAEAKLGLEFMLRATEVAQTPDYFNQLDISLSTVSGYRISVTKYFGNGREWSDYGNPGDGRNEPGYNAQFDGWGLFLWASREYVAASGDVAWLSTTVNGKTVYQHLLEGVAQKLEAAIDGNVGLITRDSSAWEDHNSYANHFLYTSAAAARGFCDMAALAEAKSDSSNASHYRTVHNSLKTALNQFKRSDNRLASAYEALSTSYYQDGSAAEVFNWGLMDPTSAVGTATLEMFESDLKVLSGGYKRRKGVRDFELTNAYNTNEWILLDFRIADVYHRAGNATKAREIIAKVVDKATANYNLLPELYDATSTTGYYTGSRPMVGYGSGAYILSMLTRSGLNDPMPCTGGCAEGTKQCNLNVPQTCTGGFWVSGAACEFACSAGDCTGECATGDKSCSNRAPRTCDATFHWQTGANCMFACVDGDCKGSCIPGDKGCNGKTPELCDDTGTMQPQTACPVLCSAGECATSCTESTKQCSRKIVQTCTGGVWMDGETCTYACKDGECSGECGPGDKRCNGRTSQQCDGSGTWQDGEQCLFACVDGDCKGSCVPDQTRCSGTMDQVCDSTGTWQDNPQGTTCGGGGGDSDTGGDSDQTGGDGDAVLAGPSLCVDTGASTPWGAAASMLALLGLLIRPARRRSS